MNQAKTPTEIDARILKGLRRYRSAWLSVVGCEEDGYPEEFEEDNINGWEASLVAGFVKYGVSKDWKNKNLIKKMYEYLSIPLNQQQHDGRNLVFNAGRLIAANKEWYEADTLARLATAFAVIGEARVRSPRICTCCNRFAVYKHTTCSEHINKHTSGVGDDDGRPTNSDLKNQLARKAKKMLANKQDIDMLVELNAIETASRGTADFAELLFPIHIDENRRLLLSVPLLHRVAAIVGDAETLAECKFEEFLDRMRKHDPIDFSTNANHWILKLWQASAHEEAQDAILAAKKPHGQRGKGKDTQNAVERATALVKSGMTATAIATALGVGKSAISNWRKRYPEFDHVMRENQR